MTPTSLTIIMQYGSLILLDNWTLSSQIYQVMISILSPLTLRKGKIGYVALTSTGLWILSWDCY